MAITLSMAITEDEISLSLFLLLSGWLLNHLDDDNIYFIFHFSLAASQLAHVTDRLYSRPRPIGDSTRLGVRSSLKVR